MAGSSGLTKQQAEIAVQTILDSIVEALQSGDKVEVRGFGSFRLRERKPRRGRNPKTSEEVQIPAKRVVYFRLGRELLKLINS